MNRELLYKYLVEQYGYVDKEFKILDCAQMKNLPNYQNEYGTDGYLITLEFLTGSKDHIRLTYRELKDWISKLRNDKIDIIIENVE